jgi:hypothetical protein
MRLVLAVHILLALRWYIDALIRHAEGRFWITNKLWLSYAYANNPQAWEDLVWDPMLRRSDITALPEGR